MLDASFAAHGSRHPRRLRGETWTAAWPNLKPAVYWLGYTLWAECWRPSKAPWEVGK